MKLKDKDIDQAYRTMEIKKSIIIYTPSNKQNKNALWPTDRGYSTYVLIILV